MDNTHFIEYNLLYRDVRCIGVNWGNNEFLLLHYGRKIRYKQKNEVHPTKDTDRILSVIDEFLGEFEKHQNINLPSYAQMKSMNHKNAYRGCEYRVNLLHDLWLSIEFQNESVISKDLDDVIRFAWETKNGFPIAAIKYTNSEEGYHAGIYFLKESAKGLSKVLANFQF